MTLYIYAENLSTTINLNAINRWGACMLQTVTFVEFTMDCAMYTFMEFLINKISIVILQNAPHKEHYEKEPMKRAAHVMSRK